MKEILFTVPPYIEYDAFVTPSFNNRTVEKKGGKFGSLVTDMPLGVLSLSAYVRQNSEYSTKLVDFNIVLNKLEKFDYESFVEFFQDFLSSQELKDCKPEVVGISSLFTPSYRSMLEIAQCCRVLFPNALIVAGGGVPTNMYKEIFRESTSFDALCYGEGEKPLLELLQAKDKRRYLEESPSWITRRKTEKTQTLKHSFIVNLDEIPFYDYSILNPDNYALSPTVNSYAHFDNKRVFHFTTSRGCPYHCTFCASHTVHGRKMRYHSVERVRHDLTRLRDQFGARMIGIQDDNFMTNKKRALEIVNIIKELGMTVFFQSGLALYALDQETLETIKEAGVDHLVLPVESGSSRVLKEVMHKPLNLSIVKRVIKDCRELDIYTDVNVLIGLPGETKKDIEDTRTFLKTLNANWFRIYIATPLVGSEMFEICAKKNYLSGSHIGSDFKKAVIETEDFTAEFIQEKIYSLNLELNFVGNSDLRLGNYQLALRGFENTIKVKSDHAFAYYFSALCCKKLKQNEKYENYRRRYEEIIKNSSFWQNYVEQ